jgi:hypothetical protein
MVMASGSLPPTRYWVDVILTTAWECRRFDCEREALAYAQVYARFPNAEAVVAYAYRPEGREIIFDWSEAEAKLGRRAKIGNPANARTRQ